MRMVPKLHSYVVARDYGFAPNPFYDFCTLATCKPRIRQSAAIGDWVVGTGSKSKARDGRLVFAMCVSEILSFQRYWEDPRFRRKRPDLRGSLKQAFGDNIYYQDLKTGQWRQKDSHHSLIYGEQNQANIDRDTGSDRVLISDNFVYWGGEGPEIPQFQGCSICKAGAGHKSNFPCDLVQEFIDWLRSLGDSGYRGTPLDWKGL